MKLFFHTIFFLFCVIVGMQTASAQIIEKDFDEEKRIADSVRYEFDHGPYFSLYKDNYFTVGTSIGPKPTKVNSDVKFQISIAQRLTKSTLPFKTYLFLFYSQKTFWNVFEKSMPMRDLNFNPGIGLAKLLIRDGKLIGKAMLLVEHESNGRDGDASRSWNKITLAANLFITPDWMIHGKFWIPIIDGGLNKDILKYSGICQFGAQYMSRNHRFGASVVLVKRSGLNLNFNTIVELNYRIFKRENQFLFLQYYNGYGESLLDFKEFHSRLRVGLVIKPRFFSEY